MSGDDLVAYYRLRTHEYDRIYTKPERQTELRLLASHLRQAVDDRQVLELAAGTGYWTPIIASAARSVVATDINSETLAVARSRDYADAEVEFRVADAYQPETVDGQFDCIVAGFFLSHVKRQSTDGLITSLIERLPVGGRVVLFDNNFVQSSNHPITHTSADGDTYQTRGLDSGESFTVLKNFYSATELEELARRWASRVHVENLDYYWFLQIDSD